jgi:prepilin-type N-terminal cleavage/methylation domain-containing protein
MVSDSSSNGWAIDDGRSAAFLFPVLMYEAMMLHRRPSAGFTLVEMLVVVAIIALLIAVLLPSMQRAKFVAKIASCASNQRQLVIGLTTYTLDNHGWYPKNGSYSRKPWAYTHHKNIPSLIKPYLGGEDISDSRWAIEAPVMVCPGSRFESRRNPDPRGHEVISYFAKFDTTNDSSAEAKGTGPDPDCDTCIGQDNAGRWYNHPPVVTPRNLMRRVNQTWTMAGQGVEYDIVIGDFFRRQGFAQAYGLQTNHVWGGTRHYAVHFTPAPVYWGALTGEGTANYGTSDGAVHQYGGFTFENLRNSTTMQKAQHHSSGMYFPIDLAR